jgi:hypothetical protein
VYHRLSFCKSSADEPGKKFENRVNNEQGTRNKVQETKYKKQGTRNKKQGTRNKEQETRKL